MNKIFSACIYANCLILNIFLASQVAMSSSDRPKDFHFTSNHSSYAIAQITPDNTTSTTVTNDGNNTVIDNGDRAEDNLFHSFEQFSVLNGNEAFFNNADDIENIFSRVTGGNISNIDGALRANGNASLFLINPAGIIFGEGARLDIGGSFYGSTASSILFEDGEFSTTELENPPLLIVNAPIGLGFKDNPGDIINRSTNSGFGLQVPLGETIGLIGGEINFVGGLVSAPGGTIELGGLTQAGTINFSDDGSLNFLNDVSKSNVFLSNQASVDITSDGGGLIIVNANILKLTEGSQLLANIGEDSGSEGAIAGTIEINSTSFSAKDNSLLHSDNLGTGQAGTVNITTYTLNFNGGSAITANTFGLGDAGTINVTAQDIVIDQEFSGIYSNVGLTHIASESENLNTDGVLGNGGIINVDTGTLLLDNGARIISSSIAQGNGGTVNINATGEVAYIGQGVTPVPALGGEAGDVVISGSASQVQQNGVGNSGEVNITADSLKLIEKGSVLTDNSAKSGDAGDINLNIQNRVFMDKIGLILAQVQGEAEGNGGNININAGSFQAQDRTFILADTKGIGDAGNININVREGISLDKSTEILTKVGDSAVGNAGNIKIMSNSLMIKDNSDIVAQTSGQGNAGNIEINTNTLSLSSESEIRADTESNGQAGNITIETQDLIVSDGSQIATGSRGQGQPGIIKIKANSIALNTEGRIEAITQSKARSNSTNIDNINLEVAKDIRLTGDSVISAQAFNDANGGNLSIDSRFIIAFPNQNSDIIARAEQGQGGNISINAQSIFGLQERSSTPENLTNDIDASSEFGFDGNISINAPDIDPTEGLTEISTTFISPKPLQSCQTQKDQSSFINIGRGGLPASSNEISNSNIWSDLRSLNNNINNSSSSIENGVSMEKIPKPIVEAQGWKINSKGKIILTAQPSNLNSSKDKDQYATCYIFQ